MHTRANTTPILTPEQVADLLIDPVMHTSAAGQVATVVNAAPGASAFRLPVMKADPSADWVAEGEEIPVSDGDVTEVVTSFFKIAGLTPVTNELANDSSPAASEMIGSGLVRDISRKLDAAFFGNLTAAAAPKGLGSLTGITNVQTPDPVTNVDPFITALSAGEQANAPLTHFAANPADVLTLAQIKKATGSNEPLLGSDPTKPGSRVIQGVPLVSSPAVAQGTIWGLHKPQVIIVVREDADVESDGSAFFTSDRTVVRARMRVGFLFPHQPGVVKLSTLVTP